MSMVEAMKLALIVGNINNMVKASDDTLSLAEVLYLATAGGAKCLQMEDLGSLDVGKRFDCVRVDLNSKDSPVDLFEWNLYELTAVPPEMVSNFSALVMYNQILVFKTAEIVVRSLLVD